jgi:hypothetical protein
MRSTAGQSSTEDRIRDILETHYEAHENPHVTIAKIWAALNAIEWGHEAARRRPAGLN